MDCGNLNIISTLGYSNMKAFDSFVNSLGLNITLSKDLNSTDSFRELCILNFPDFLAPAWRGVKLYASQGIISGHNWCNSQLLINLTLICPVENTRIR